MNSHKASSIGGFLYFFADIEASSASFSLAAPWQSSSVTYIQGSATNAIDNVALHEGVHGASLEIVAALTLARIVGRSRNQVLGWVLAVNTVLISCRIYAAREIDEAYDLESRLEVSGSNAGAAPSPPKPASADQLIVFSGSFLPGDTDCVQETSLTQGGP